jgi:signal transduction histidine kinase
VPIISPSREDIAMKRRPLRRQIMLPLLAVAVASLGAVGAINAQFAARQTRERIERQLDGVISVLTTSNFPLTDSVLRQMRGLSGAEFVVADDAGAVQAATFSPDVFEPGDEVAASSSRLGERILVDSRAYFHRIADLPLRTGQPNASRLHVLYPETEYRQAWRAAMLPPIVVGAVTIAAIAGVAIGIAGRISRATAQVSEEMLRVAKGDFSPSALPATNDEIRDLAIAVNRTAGMLGDYERQVRRTEQLRTAALLGAGIAHEMRNAATGCRMAIDLHAETCPALNDEALAVAKRQLQLMESQLQKYLQAGKAAAIGVHREVDLGHLFEDVLQLVGPAARHAKVELCWDRLPGDVTVDGDDEALGQAIVNLLINAIEAVQQPGGGEPRCVHVKLHSINPGFAELVVADNGPGPLAALADELFAPFVSSKPEGAGLGLANVKRIVEAHRGAVDWVRAEGMTRFRIEIPLTKRGAPCV